MGAGARLLLGSVVLLAGCATTGGSAAPVGAPATAALASASASAATGCGSRVDMGSLPDWADAGFSGDARVPHVLGGKGDIVAVLFGYPLRQDRSDGSNNKILWVSRPATTSPDTTSDTLVIIATLNGTDTRVTREVTGGPGPSIIDMPQPGCWHLELRWSGRIDTMDLVYADS